MHTARRWFEQFLADRGIRKPSAHTLKAYRQDFDAIAALLAGDTPRPGAATAGDHRHRSDALGVRRAEAASIRRCWSTWNVLCTFLFTAEMIPANPDADDRATWKQPKALPKSLPP